MFVKGGRLEPNANALPPFEDQWVEFIGLLDQWRLDNPKRLFRSLVQLDRWRTSYWVLRQINMWGDEVMARGKAKTSARTATSGKQWTTFVEISLAGHDMEAIEKEFGTVDALFDALSTMLTEGYRISLAYNPQNDAIIASVTCKDEESHNAGCTYTSFAMDWVMALKIAAYKHFVVTEQNWIGVAGTSTRPSFG